MIGKMGSDRSDDEGSDTNPVGDEIDVHADVGSDFTVPITNDLEFVEAVFECIFVICTGTTG